MISKFNSNVLKRRRDLISIINKTAPKSLTQIKTFNKLILIDKMIQKEVVNKIN